MVVVWEFLALYSSTNGKRTSSAIFSPHHRYSPPCHEASAWSPAQLLTVKESMAEMSCNIKTMVLIMVNNGESMNNIWIIDDIFGFGPENVGLIFPI